MNLGVGHADIVLPGMDEYLASDGRLAEHGHRCPPPFQEVQELHEHPFGYVKIAFAGEGFQSLTILESLISSGRFELPLAPSVAFVTQGGFPTTKIGSGRSSIKVVPIDLEEVSSARL